MLLLKKDALVVHHHAQTILFFGAHLFAMNWVENWFSDGMHALLIGSQNLSTLDNRRINLVGFHIKTGRFWYLFTLGALNI